MKKFFTFTLAALATVVSFAGTLTCDEAVTIAQGLEPNTPTEDEYIVEGYVVSVIKSSATDLRFWMADDATAERGTFEAWMCTGDVVNKGDKVTVTGYIQWYVNQNNEDDQKAEIAEGTVVVVEPAPIDMNYVEFYSSDFEGKGTESSGDEISFTKNGVTVYTDGGFGASYSLRVYKNKQFSISADRRIVKISFSFDSYNDNPYDGGLDPQVCVEGTEWEVASMASQARISKIAVTLGDAACSIVPPVVETITIEEALTIGDALEDNASTANSYVIEGYVVKAYEFDEEHQNQSFYLSDDPNAEFGDFFAKYTTGDVVAEGDKVRVAGKIEKNVRDDKVTIQIYRGVATIVSHEEVTPISVADALEIGETLEDNASTDERYVVKGYVVKAYEFDEEHKNQSFYLSDDPNAEFGDFFAKYTTGDVVAEGDKVQVAGKIEKNVKDDKVTIQIFRGVATVLSRSALENVNATKKAAKYFDGKQVVFVVNGVQYNVLGNIVK